MEVRGEGSEDALTRSTIAVTRTEDEASPRTPAHFVRAGRRAWKLSARTLASGNLEAFAHSDANVSLSRRRQHGGKGKMDEGVGGNEACQGREEMRLN